MPERAVMPDDGPSPLEYARRFYYDSLVFDRRALRYLVDVLGSGPAAGRLGLPGDAPRGARPGARFARWTCPRT